MAESIADVRHLLENVLAELRASDQRFRNLILNTADAIIIVDKSGVVQFVNPAAENLFDRPAKVMLGEMFGFPVVVGEATELDVCRRSGESVVAEMHVVETEWEGQTACLASLRDITHRKQTEKELKELAIALQQSNRELREFAQIASHDLQEPLRKIQAFGERLKSRYGDALNGEGRDYLDRMQSGAQRMQNLINGLLTFSRVTTGGRRFMPTNLNEVLKDVLSDLEVRIEQSEGRVEAEELPVINADPIQMHQLLLNVIGNALKFHRPDVPPLVRVYSQHLHERRQRGDGPFGELCQLMVEDNGIGFDEQYVNSIFNVFQRLHTRRQYEGTGLGLAVCRKIAERHGGSITARSVPHQGATFIITLPFKHPKGGIVNE